MSTKVWLGGAAKKAQVDRVIVPRDVESGMVIRASIGYKSITYTVLSTDDRDDVVDAIVTKWNSSSKYEFAEVTAAVEYDDSYDEAVRTGGITLTADTPGIPFIVLWTIGDSSGNEKQIITIMNTATGGTFTLTFSGQTTTDLDFDATAAEVESALEALTSIGAGNVSVTGDNGGPWTVELTGDLAETNVSKITGDSSNLTSTSEIQTVTLATATGGTFTLLFEEDETSNLDFDATAAEVQSALEALPSIGSGNVSVSGPDGGPWVVTFQGDLSLDQPLLEVDGTNLTGTLSVGISTTTPGASGVNEVQLFYAYKDGELDRVFQLWGDSSATAGTFSLSITLDGDSKLYLSGIPYDVTGPELQVLLDEAAGSNYDPGAIHVVSANGAVQLDSGASFAITVFNATVWSGAIEISVLNSLTGGTYSVTAGSGTMTSVLGGSSSGSYFIKFGTQQTIDIPINASPATVQSALESLSTIGVGNVSVTSAGPGTGLAQSGVLIVEFIGALSNQNVSIGTASIGTNDTEPIGYSLATLPGWSGVLGTNEVQRLSISGSPTSGQFALRFDSENTSLLDYDSTAAEIETALTALTGIGTGNAECTGGPLPGTPIDVEFTGTLGSADVALVENVGGGLVNETQPGGYSPYLDIDTYSTPMTHTTVTANEGPNDWTTVDNWSTAELPVDGDKVYIIDNAYSILYGLDQASVTLAELHIEQTYTGLIGLPVINVNSDDATIAYPEYRDQYLKIGATNVYIGDKDGDGSQRLKINFGSVQTTILVTNSGGRLDDATPPIQFLGTHASNVLNINRGDVAIAFYPGEVSAFPTIRQAFIDNAEADATLYVGDDVTLTNIYKSGGIATLKSATTLIDQTAGTLTIEEGAHAEINSFAGQVYYNSIDTLSLIDISGDTTLSFDQDRRPKDVTLIKVNGSEPEVYDQSNAIASPKVNLERGATNQQLYFGSKIQLTISSIS
jgi:hypothetical protein